jgi:hypothetical protein
MISEYEGPLRASSRDASAVAMPDCYSPKKIHVAVRVKVLSSVGTWDGETLCAEAACDPERMPLDMNMSFEADEVPLNRRCRRPGCVRLWPDYVDPKEKRRA